MHLDHFIYVSDDPEAAAGAIRSLFGFGSVPGGVHPGGTCNVIVPLAPPQYLELVGVADPEGNVGRRLSAFLATEGDQLGAWGLRVDDAEVVADRLGLDVVPGSITYADGSTGTWQYVAHPDNERELPFYIQYDNPEERRQRREAEFEAARHDIVPGPIAWVEVGGDERELKTWLGPDDLPVVFAGGSPGLRAVAIATEAGEVVIPKRLPDPEGRQNL
jgi:Glyoxalase-like domain